MSSKEKTLVILTPAFPANESDAVWVHSLQSLLKSINKLFPHIRIEVISFIYPHTNSTYQWKDCTVHSFDGNKYKKLKRPLLWAKAWKKLALIDREKKIDALLSIWCSECALVGHYFGKKNSIKHFTWICGQDARKTNKMVKLIRPLPEELIAKSDFLVDEFYKNHKIKPAHLIPNGIDTSLFFQITAERSFDISGAGSLSFIKQYDIFLEVIAALKDHRPGIKAVLMGDGEHAEELKNMRDKLSLQQNVSFKGMLTPGETIQWMQQSKIFLHPSSYEGFSMACLEALAAGNHVISFVKPMHHDIKNWHVVKSKEHMIQKALELLSGEIKNEPVWVYKMEDSAKKMIRLLGLVE
jgi:glycosyltransferase involved in cell wall biosynthesis